MNTARCSELPDTRLSLLCDSTVAAALMYRPDLRLLCASASSNRLLSVSGPVPTGEVTVTLTARPQKLGFE